MTGREFKDLTFHQFAKIANAFSSPKRLEIIDILSQSEKDVDTISKETNMNFANTSRHLQILKRLENDEVTLIDVRPKEEYSSGHIAGAVSVPLTEIKEENIRLPKEKDI